MNPAYRELCEKYPLGVKFPNLSGRFLLLNWWTHGDQNHVILAKDVPGLVATFSAIIKKGADYDLKPVACWEIDIVSPPETLELSQAILLQEQEKESFFSYVVQLLKDARGPLPAGVTRCDNYEPDADHAGADPDDTWLKENHYGCLNCLQGFCFDREAVYASRIVKYRATEASGPYAKISRKSIAARCTPGKKLFVVQDEFGHHSKGSCLQEVAADVQYILSEVKFFCHSRKLKMPAEIKQLHADLLAEKKARDEKSKTDWAQRVAKQEAEAGTAAAAFFAD